MSDAGRKDFATKAKEELIPDSTKSTQDKVGETFTDTTDRVSRGLQGDDSKGGAQEVADRAQRASDNHAHDGATGSIGDKVKKAFGLGDH